MNKHQWNRGSHVGEAFPDPIFTLDVTIESLPSCVSPLGETCKNKWTVTKCRVSSIIPTFRVRTSGFGQFFDHATGIDRISFQIGQRQGLFCELFAAGSAAVDADVTVPHEGSSSRGASVQCLAARNGEQCGIRRWSSMPRVWKCKRLRLRLIHWSCFPCTLCPWLPLATSNVLGVSFNVWSPPEMENQHTVFYLIFGSPSTAASLFVHMPGSADMRSPWTCFWT